MTRTKAAARPESLPAAHETNAVVEVLVAPAAIGVAIDEVHVSRVVRISGVGRTRPEIRTRGVREKVCVDGRQHPAILDETGKFLHAGEAPVGVVREGADLGVSQRLGPGESVRGTGLAGRAAQSCGVLLPAQACARIGGRAAAVK